MNTYTVEALQKALTPTDDPELRALLYHDDPIVIRTAASVFSARADRGLAVLREVTVDAALPANNRSVIDDVIWTANARHAAAMGAKRLRQPWPGTKPSAEAAPGGGDGARRGLDHHGYWK